MDGYCPFPACLLSKGPGTSTLLLLSVTFDKGEEVSEVFKFEQACGEKRQLRGARPLSAQPREGCSAPNSDVVAETLYKNI